MMKRVAAFLLFLLIAGCTPAGQVGGKCLEGNRCAGFLGVNAQCNANNKCELCGGTDQPCCRGRKCDGNSECGIDNICHRCGGTGEPCCSTIIPKCEFAVCGLEGKCIDQICDPSGQCQECGDDLKPCCEGNLCNVLSVCGEDGQCHGCGGMNQPVCQDGSCKGWFKEFNGSCNIPFLNGGQADISVCERASPGHLERDERDWCIWYVAWYQRDTSICQAIHWFEMKDKCLKGGNPDNYFFYH